jgi:hypothetical protein
MPGRNWQGARRVLEEADRHSGHAKVLGVLDSLGFGPRADDSGHAFGPRPPKLRRKGTVAVKERLAEARRVQELLDTGQALSAAAVARERGVTRPAIAKLLSLLRLAPEIQAYIDRSTGALGEYHLTEKICRKLVRLRTPERQLEVFRSLVAGQAAFAAPSSSERPGTAS